MRFTTRNRSCSRGVAEAVSSRIALAVVAIVAVFAVASGDATSDSHVAAACTPALVRYEPYPGGDRRLDTLPWVRGLPRAVGLVGLLWYWPDEWRQSRLRWARIFTGGVAPAGYSTKILWAFVAPSAKFGGGRQLVVQGRRLDEEGTFRQEFAAISSVGHGAPSYASIINVPKAGCWRLQLSTGRLRASAVFRAVAGTS